MNPTSQIVEQAIAKQEAEEAGIVVDDDKKGGADDKGTTQNAGAGKPEPKKDDKPAGGEEPNKPAPEYDENGKRIDPKEVEAKKAEEAKKTEEEEGKYTADDALEVEEKKNEQPQPTDPSGIQLSPAEQKYIADNIGEPIVIRGIRGTGDDAKEVEIKAYSPQDIPADFRFANDQQMMAAGDGFRRLEERANGLLGNYRQQQSQTAAQDFERRENEGIQADLADLQKEGRFPKFKVKPGDSGFDDDPAAKQMTEVLKIMSDKNELYLKQYNQGRPYKHIGFAEAFDIWEQQSPDRAAARKAEEDQKREDEERGKRGTERGDSNRGMTTSNLQKPVVKSGTTTRDILARIDALD